MRSSSLVSWSVVAAVFLACGPSNQQHLRPPPPPSTGRPVSDPPPSRVVLHATIFRDGLTKALALALPRAGEGDVELFAGQTLHYRWQREPVALRFDRGRIFVTVNVEAHTNLPGVKTIPISITIAGEPIVTADFKAVLQSSEVTVKATSTFDTVNQGVEAKLHDLVAAALEGFRMDVRPLLLSGFSRIAKPIEIPVGDQVACVELHIASLEAGPTVLADGIEKDVAAVVMPSVTLPCTPVASLASAASPDGGVSVAAPPAMDGGSTTVAVATSGGTPVVASASADGGTPQVAQAAAADAGTPQVALPLLQNVAALPSGPFSVVIPVAAGYSELSGALSTAIKGKMFFSDNHPDLYLYDPQVYASDDQVVIRFLLGGKATVGSAKIDMDGEIYFAGHPRVIDNQITIPDLDITQGTANALVGLKLALDHDSLVEQARSSLRVDVSERLAAVKNKLSTELTFAEDLGCVRANVLRSEVTGIYAHANYLRIYVTVDAQAGVYLPCRK